MDQQGNADILDLSGQYPDFDFNNNNVWSSSQVNGNANRTRGEVQNNYFILGGPVSAEELRIRGELEMDIERDLEEEIKNGIYQFALRLHRLYQHRKERNAKQAEQNNKISTLSEVNISIKMEGGTKIEIKETKKEAPLRSLPRSSRSGTVKELPDPNIGKKFDWVKTLRSTAAPAVANRRNGRAS